MKKLIVVLIVMFLVCHVSLAQADSLFGNDHFTANIFINFMLFDKIDGPGDKVLSSILTSTFSLGAGYHWNIVPHIISPGIYGEGGISLLTLLLSNSDDDKNNTTVAHDAANDNYFFGFLGIRLYNQFSFAFIDIQPFFGLNLTGGFSTLSSSSVGFYDFGVLAAFKRFGMEYGCYIPLTEYGRNNTGIMHRVSFGFHI